MTQTGVSFSAVVLLLLATLSASAAAAFHLPGTGPRNFYDGDMVEIQTNVLTSLKTHVPYEYYSIPTCRPKKKQHGDFKNLGEFFMGDSVLPSPYENIVIGVDQHCALACPEVLAVDARMQQRLAKYIRDDYRVNLLMDGLPLAVEDNESFSVGVPLGIPAHGSSPAYLYNHLHFHVRYYELTEEETERHHAVLKKQGKAVPQADAEGGAVSVKRIISFVAKPMSIKHDLTNPPRTCIDTAAFSAAVNRDENGEVPHAEGADAASIAALRKAAEAIEFEPLPVTESAFMYSYGITWERTDEAWATRWDVYLNASQHEVHWLAIIHAVLIVIILTTMVGIIFLRALKRDITKYNRDVEDPEELQEETGWKLVHKDVFRPPQRPALLAALTGTGVQILGMAFAVTIIACFGFLAPQNRGALFSAVLICFVFLGACSGYVAARLLKMWGVPSWAGIMLTATLVPGIAFATFFTVNLAVWSLGSASAVPVLMMFVVLAIWFFISVPLIVIGAIFGFKADAITPPVPTSQISRHIPAAPWHLHPVVMTLVGGILPYGAIFLEFYFILAAVWLNSYYYVFGFFLLVLVILVVTCAEMTIVLTYFQLCAEDHRWWWRSFTASGACGLYVWLYTIYYFFTSVHLSGFVPVLIYFSYMTLLSFVVAVMAGAVGFLSSLLFVRYIYGQIRID
jgi:transmembrane 9 superfamily protein 2/4